MDARLSPTELARERAVCADYLAGRSLDELARRHNVGRTKAREILIRRGAWRFQVGSRVEYPTNPPAYLAEAVIARALGLWHRVNVTPERARSLQAAKDHHYLLRFFASELFQFWCDLADLDSDAVIERNDIPLGPRMETREQRRALENSPQRVYHGISEGSR
ncbi:MAG: hypothetical protein GXY76_16970 [Chloroflexi bacterium]|nr:hypothetical protein [Chloroflexota bacterium]